MGHLSFAARLRAVAEGGSVDVRVKTLTISGRRYELARADRFQSLDEAQARALVRDALDDEGGHLLHRLADACGLDSIDRREVVDRVAREIARGNFLVYVEELEGGIDPQIGVDELQWDDLPSLGDLRVDGPDEGERPVVATTWVSFAIVDERGLLAAGDYACNIDGTERSGELAKEPQYFDKLRFGARARLRAFIRFNSSGPDPGSNDPILDPDPDVPRADDPVRANEVTFEVMDDAGRPLPGRYSFAEGTHEGVLKGRTRVAVASPPRLSIHIDWPSATRAER